MNKRIGSIGSGNINRRVAWLLLIGLAVMLPGDDISMAYSVNASGHVAGNSSISYESVGQGYYNGRLEAFLLTPVPEPSSFALVAAGTFALLTRRCK